MGEWGGRARGRIRWRSAAIVAVSAAVVLAPASTGLADAAPTNVSGGGSSFAAPEIQQWAADVFGAPYDLTVNYAADSSGAGRSDYAQGFYQYAASDTPYTPNDANYAQEAANDHPYVLVPVTSGGLAFPYDLTVGGARWTGLNLTPDEVCQIFTGALTMWDDPELVATPGDAVLASVDEPITNVVRSDPAGESYALSQYCLAVDPGDWDTFVTDVEQSEATYTGRGWAGDTGLAAHQPIEYWPPIDLTAGGATEEINDVADADNGATIGYAADVYAAAFGLPTASVENASGAFVQPGPANVQAGLADATTDPDGAIDPDFANPDPDAYLPATYSYVIAPTTTDAPTSAGADQTLAQFLCYDVGQGQSDATRLDYAPLSPAVTADAVQAIEQIPGSPAPSACVDTTPTPALPELPDPAAALLIPAAVLAPVIWWRRRRTHALPTAQ
jgi:phosphate transport system substrate-binding protein